MDYDVVVAGAGPAGLMTAHVLSKNGLNVLLVEQKKEIAKVYRSCCCNLIIEAGTHKEAVGLDSGRITFKENGFSIPYSGKVMGLKKSIKISPGGKTFVIDGAGLDGCVALSIEKEALLQDMLQQVQQEQVTIVCQTQAVGVENTDGGVTVTLQNADGEYQVQAKVAVAADGVNSRLVQSLGLNKSRRKFFARFGVASYHLEGVNCPYPDAWLTFAGKGQTMGGRGQLYMCPKPHGGRTDPPVYELTCGTPILQEGGGYTPRAEIEHFIQQGAFSPWFKQATVVEKRAAILNFHTPLTNPVEGNVVVVGDAAAFIETYVQGAVMYGFQAGNAIVEYLKTGSGLEAYARAWEESFEYNDPKEIAAATQAFGLHVLEDEELDYFFSLAGGDTRKGYVNEFSDPRVVRNAIFRHLDRIKKERPELGAKLDKFHDTSVEDALQVGSEE